MPRTTFIVMFAAAQLATANPLPKRAGAKSMSPTEPLFTLTLNALAILMQAQERPSSLLDMRLSVSVRSRTDFSYHFDFDTEGMKATDETFSFEGIRFFVDKQQVPHLRGTVIDYVANGPEGAGFKFYNPNLGDQWPPPKTDPSTPIPSLGPREGPEVYDKAKWHRDGKWPKDLPDAQAFVHTGMYLGWLIDHALYSDEFAEEARDEILAFRQRKMTGPQLYAMCDGILVEDMLNAEGNAFSQAYFDFDKGAFMGDYRTLLVGSLPSDYHVKDTWQNYDKIKSKFDERFAEWQQHKRR